MQQDNQPASRQETGSAPRRRDPASDEALNPTLDDMQEDAALAEGDIVADEDELNAQILPLEEEITDDADAVIGEDDDNPYEESDEALPDDREERSISRDISREGSRFDEV